MLIFHSPKDKTHKHGTNNSKTTIVSSTTGIIIVVRRRRRRCHRPHRLRLTPSHRITLPEAPCLTDAARRYVLLHFRLRSRPGRTSKATPTHYPRPERRGSAFSLDSFIHIPRVNSPAAAVSQNLIMRLAESLPEPTTTTTRFWFFVSSSDGARVRVENRTIAL